MIGKVLVPAKIIVILAVRQVICILMVILKGLVLIVVSVLILHQMDISRHFVVSVQNHKRNDFLWMLQLERKVS